jgi:hypothetical protein
MAAESATPECPTTESAAREVGATAEMSAAEVRATTVETATHMTATTMSAARQRRRRGRKCCSKTGRAQDFKFSHLISPSICMERERKVRSVVPDQRLR